MEVVTIRPAGPDDIPAVLKLIKCLSSYLKCENEVINTERALLRDGFGKKSYFHCLVAEGAMQEENNNHEGLRRIVGYVAYFFGYSSKQGRILYLDDFFILPEFRCQGVGKLLLVNLAKIAVQMECVFAEGVCASWNVKANEFYRSIGAQCHQEYGVYHLEQDALREYVENFSAEHNAADIIIKEDLRSL